MPTVSGPREPSHFDQRIAAMRRRVVALQHAAATDSNPDKLLTAVFDELAAALEELSVSAEELQQRHQEMAAVNDAVAEHQRYQELFEFAPDAYVVTDPAAIIREANRAAETLLHRRRIYLIGKPLVVFVAEGDRHRFRTQGESVQQSPVLSSPAVGS